MIVFTGIWSYVELVIDNHVYNSGYPLEHRRRGFSLGLVICCELGTIVRMTRLRILQRSQSF